MCQLEDENIRLKELLGEACEIIREGRHHVTALLKYHDYSEEIMDALRRIDDELSIMEEGRCVRGLTVLADMMLEKDLPHHDFVRISRLLEE